MNRSKFSEEQVAYALPGPRRRFVPRFPGANEYRRPRSRWRMSARFRVVDNGPATDLSKPDMVPPLATLRGRAILLWAALTTVIASPAPALVLCKGRKPTVALRDRCKRGEQQVDAATLGGLTGDRGPSGPPILVVDKDGTEVGPVVQAFGDTASVVREINGELFTIGVSASGFGEQISEVGDNVYYTDPACTSEPYVETRPGPFVELTHRVRISGDGRTGYYGLASEQRVVPKSYLISLESGGNDTQARDSCVMGRGGQIVKDVHDCLHPEPGAPRCVWCCEEQAGNPLSPAHTIDLSSLGLVPPFALKPQAPAPVTASTGGGPVFCKGRKPTVALRDGCKKKEQPLDAATIGGLKGGPGPTGPTFEVVDKDDKEVGQPVEIDGDTGRVVRQLDGDFFAFRVAGSGFVSFSREVDSFLVYTDPACTGQPYVGIPLAPVVPLAHDVFASIDGRTGYFGLVSEQQAPPAMYTVNLRSGTDDADARSGCTNVGSQIVKDAHDCLQPEPPRVKCVWCCDTNRYKAISPARTIDLSSLGVTPPFTLKRR